MGNLNIKLKMKYTSILVIAALFAASTVEPVQAVELAKKKKEDPPPTAADTPTSGYFGADEDDVMNNIFNHYAVEVTNEAGAKTGQKVLYKDGAQKSCAEVLLVTKQVSEPRWRLIWLNSSQEPGPNSTLTTLVRSISPSPTLS